MHFSHGFIPIEFCYQFYGSLILVGIFGGLASFCLAIMSIYGVPGIQVVFGLSVLGFLALVQTLILPLFASAQIEYAYDSIPLETKCKLRELHDLAVDTLVLKETDDTVVFSPMSKNPLCSICLQAFEIDQEISVVESCQHTFHSQCLKLWIQTSATCPYCRKDL
mmetsp:Transcript_25018/g.59043  ORF Transcript_25018/g.59043 Transcript_25018/m.59043 type:complete len:165 (-) Transcript_25018:663-1157(-)